MTTARYQPEELREAAEKHAEAKDALDAWFREASAAKWKSLIEVRKVYPHADGVRVGEWIHTVFNICGNQFRLIAGVNYRTGRVFVKHFLTHAEYDKGDWKR
jgi:mRNA interferase HigB